MFSLSAPSALPSLVPKRLCWGPAGRRRTEGGGRAGGHGDTGLKQPRPLGERDTGGGIQYLMGHWERRPKNVKWCRVNWCSVNGQACLNYSWCIWGSSQRSTQHFKEQRAKKYKAETKERKVKMPLSGKKVESLNWAVCLLRINSISAETRGKFSIISEASLWKWQSEFHSACIWPNVLARPHPASQRTCSFRG